MEKEIIIATKNRLFRYCSVIFAFQDGVKRHEP